MRRQDEVLRRRRPSGGFARDDDGGKETMKLGSLKEGGRDGTLIVVDRAVKKAVRAGAIAPTLQKAFDDWTASEPKLRALAQQLADGKAAGAFDLDTRALAAPLPRAYQ